MTAILLSRFLCTLFPPEVLFVVDHALDDGAHGDTVNQLVPQRGQLGVKVHLQIQTRRGGYDHIFCLRPTQKKERMAAGFSQQMAAQTEQYCQIQSLIQSLILLQVRT